MNEQYLTWAQIEATYPSEWVLIDRPTTKRKSLEVTGGYVAFHCADRAEFLRRAGDFPGITEGAVLYAGKFVDELDVLEPDADMVTQQ